MFGHVDVHHILDAMFPSFLKMLSHVLITQTDASRAYSFSSQHVNWRGLSMFKSTVGQKLY